MIINWTDILDDLLARLVRVFAKAESMRRLTYRRRIVASADRDKQCSDIGYANRCVSLWPRRIDDKRDILRV